MLHYHRFGDFTLTSRLIRKIWDRVKHQKTETITSALFATIRWLSSFHFSTLYRFYCIFVSCHFDPARSLVFVESVDFCFCSSATFVNEAPTSASCRAKMKGWMREWKKPRTPPPPSLPLLPSSKSTWSQQIQLSFQSVNKPAAACLPGITSVALNMAPSPSALHPKQASLSHKRPY